MREDERGPSLREETREDQPFERRRERTIPSRGDERGPTLREQSGGLEGWGGTNSERSSHVFKGPCTLNNPLFDYPSRGVEERHTNPRDHAKTMLTLSPPSLHPLNNPLNNPLFERSRRDRPTLETVLTLSPPSLRPSVERSRRETDQPSRPYQDRANPLFDRPSRGVKTTLSPTVRRANPRVSLYTPMQADD